MSWRFLLVMSVLAVMGSSHIAVAATTEGRLENVVVSPQPFLGLAFPPNETKYYKLLSDAGLGVARLVATWEFREPKPGQFFWAGTDERIVALQKLGIEPFLTLESKSDWGVTEKTSMLTNGSPKDMKQWTRYVRKLVERYDGDGIDDAPGLLRPVRMYQVANEWEGSKNVYGGWGGTTRELIEFINATYDAIKEQSRDAIVVLGGMAAGNLDGLALNMGVADFEFLRRKGPDSKPEVIPAEHFRTARVNEMVRSKIRPVLLNARYDILDLHLYGPSDHDTARIKAIRSIVGDRPLLSAECGGPSMHYNMRYVPSDHFMAVVRRNMIVLSEGLKFCLWFKLGEGSLATFGNSKTALFDINRKPKPGYRAYILLAAALQDMERVERRGKDHVYIIHRREKPPLLLGWVEQGDKERIVTLPPKASGHMLRVTDPVSGRYEISEIPSSKSVRLGKWPVIVGRLPDALL